MVVKKQSIIPGMMKSRGSSQVLPSFGERESALMFGKLDTGRAIPADKQKATGTAILAASVSPRTLTLNSTMNGIKTFAAAV
jgi:hypothetical protein